MTHFAIIAPPFHSHIRALEAVAEILIERGHQATFLHQSDVGTLIRSKAVGFRVLGEDSHPPGSLARTLRIAAQPDGPLGILRLVHDVSRATAMFCRDGRAALEAIGADCVIADQMEPAGGLLAESLGLPFVSIASALPVNREPDVPLPYMPWGYDPRPEGRRWNSGGQWVSDLLTVEHSRAIRTCAKSLGVPERSRLDECLSPLLQISQLVRGFDFPRRQLPACFHYVGPLRAPGGDGELGLTIEPDRPFVFASLGTLQGGRKRIFQAIAKACRKMDYQLLAAHCGHLSDREADDLGATWVTDFAPQRAVLARADLAITHAGLNTVLDSLSFGVPMLAIPIAFDQPGTAARIVHAGVGERVARQFLTEGRISSALRKLSGSPAYAEAARSFIAELDGSGGAMRAADLIEEAAALKRAVTARHSA